MDQILAYALRLLARRDYARAELVARLERKFGEAPEAVMDTLLARRYLDDRRYAENYVRTRRNRGRRVVEHDLLRRGVAPGIVAEAIEREKWPSLADALKARMIDLGLDPPLSRREATRLFRDLERLGYEAEEIRLELEAML